MANATGLALRHHYLQHRAMYSGVFEGKLHPKWDGGVDSRGARHRGVWDKFGEYADTHRIDPAQWVSALFSMANEIGRMPWPSDLNMPAVLAKIAGNGKANLDERVRELRSDRLNFLREVALRCVATKLPEPEVTLAVIVDGSVPSSDFCRYAAAIVAGKVQLASKFFLKAKSQYQAWPEAYALAFPVGSPLRLAVAVLEEATR
jgi:hypothetical protein